MSSRKSEKAQARAARLAREAQPKPQARRRRVPARTSILVAFALILVAGIAVAGSHGQQDQRFASAPRIKLASLASLGPLKSPPAAGALGPEGVPLPDAPALAPAGPASRSVDGVQCLGNEQLAFHIHAHLTLFLHGVASSVPYAVGIKGPQTINTPQGIFVGAGRCFFWLHTHAADGIIHIESPIVRIFTLGDFFDIWGQKLAPDRVGPAVGPVTAIYNGRRIDAGRTHPTLGVGRWHRL